MTWAAPGLLRIRQTVEVRGREPGLDATGPYWVFAVVRVHSGGIRYLHGRVQVAAPGPTFAVFMPPGSIVHAAPAVCRVSTDALTSAHPLFDGAPTRPVAWRWRGERTPTTIAEVVEAVRAGGLFVEVSREVDPPPIAQRCKAILDETYHQPVTLGSLARQTGVSTSAMSRSFKQAFGMPPVEYRHRLRIMDAMFRLACGGEILTVLEDVGFTDASRLYRHFRTLLCASPGSYAAFMSRNAKT